jgi:hypothetical protein
LAAGAGGHPPGMTTLEVTPPADPDIPDTPVEPPIEPPGGPTEPDPSPPEQPDPGQPDVPTPDPKGPETDPA